MTSKRSEYLRATTSGLIAKGMSMVAGVASLWLINQMIDKEQFGAYSFTIAAISLLSIIGTAGLNQAVLYRLSRMKVEPGELGGGGNVVWALQRVTTTSLIVAGLGALGAAILAPQSDLPDLEVWFFALAVIIPLSSLSGVFSAWHSSQRQVHKSLVVPRLNEISLAVLMALAWLALPGAIGVAVATVLAALIPVGAWWIIVPDRAYRRSEPLPKGDAAYGMNMTLTVVAEQGVRRIDLLMLGFLAAAVLSADYALASRLVAATTVGNELLGAVFTPRMGRFLEGRDYEGLASEYDMTRSLALAAGLAVVSVFTLWGRQILTFFGDFESALPVLLILSAAFLVKTGFGSNGRYLNMSGRAGWNLATTILLLAAMGGFNLLLIPRFGAIGAALATLVSFGIINAIQSSVIWYKDRVPTMHLDTLVVIFTAVALLLLASFDHLAALPTVIGLGALALYSGRRGWPIAWQLTSSFISRRRSD